MSISENVVMPPSLIGFKRAIVKFIEFYQWLQAMMTKLPYSGATAVSE